MTRDEIEAADIERIERAYEKGFAAGIEAAASCLVPKEKASTESRMLIAFCQGKIRALAVTPKAVEPTCATCKGKGRIVTGMEAVHAPPAPMMMITVTAPCPDCSGGGR